jgi:hypothetical protein
MQIPAAGVKGYQRTDKESLACSWLDVVLSILERIFLLPGELICGPIHLAGVAIRTHKTGVDKKFHSLCIQKAYANR